MAGGHEKQLVGRFILTTFRAGTILGTEHVEAIEAAQARLYRSIKHAQKVGKKGGRKRDPNPSPAALAKRRERERDRRK